MDRVIEELLLFKKKIPFKNFYLRNITVKDRLDLGVNENNDFIYDIYMNLMTTNTARVAHYLLVEDNIWYEDVDEWQCFITNCIQDYQGEALYKQVFRYLFGINFLLMSDEDGSEFFFIDEDEKYIIEEADFFKIREIYCKMSYISLEQSWQKISKKKYIQKEELKIKYENRNDPFMNRGISFRDIFGCVMWGTTLGEKVFDLTIYAVYDCYYTITKREEYVSLITGMYSGGISMKPSELDRYHWSQK